MSSFEELRQQIQENDLCHRCGGCITFCTAVNYGALELKEEGYPGYKDRNLCIECGICHMICPEIEDLNEEIQSLAEWKEPVGNVVSTSIVRSRDKQILDRATDGGAVTGILSYLLEKGVIDSAIVSKNVGLFNREPFLARTRDDLISSSGSFFDISHGMVLYSEHYSTFTPSIQALESIKRTGGRKVAFVGTPCQVAAIRKMQVLGVVPSEAVYCVFGLFCSGNFSFDDKARKTLERIGRFQWNQVRKINIKDKMYVLLDDGSIHTLPLDELDFIMRPACRYCQDYTAELADLSFGGIGSEDGWTTVLARSRLGLSILKNAQDNVLESFPFQLSSPDLEEQSVKKRMQKLQRSINHLEYKRKLGESSEVLDSEYRRLLSELDSLQQQHTEIKLEPGKSVSASEVSNTLDRVIEKAMQKKKRSLEKRSELGMHSRMEI